MANAEKALETQRQFIKRVDEKLRTVFPSTVVSSTPIVTVDAAIHDYKALQEENKRLKRTIKMLEKY